MTNFESLGNFMSKQDNMPGQAGPVKGHWFYRIFHIPFKHLV